MFDTIIIGAGPAGMTAGIYAVRRAMKALVISKDIGGQMQWASDIENYPGFKSIKGFELINKMNEHAVSLGVDIKLEEVKKIDTVPDMEQGLYYVLHTEKETYETKTIIIAMGLSPRRLVIPGEIELGGKGVSYCASCDAPFFKGKTVAVVGGGNSALDAAELLSKIAAKVYLIYRGENFRGFEGLVADVKSKENIEILMSSEVKEILGFDKVESVKIFNNKNNEEKEIMLDGIFIEIGRIAHTDLFEGLVERNGQKQVITDELCRTSSEGIFAAGDVTNVAFKQITIACGQATIAALAAYQYLQTKSGEKAEVSDRGKANN